LFRYCFLFIYLFIYLFTCGLFNDAVSSSVGTAWNDRVKWKQCGRKMRWLNFTYEWFQASAAMQMRSELFWDTTQRRVVFMYRRFGTFWSHLKGSRGPRRKVLGISEFAWNDSWKSWNTPVIIPRLPGRYLNSVLPKHEETVGIHSIMTFGKIIQAFNTRPRTT
jgi:hypothetical protein